MNRQDFLDAIAIVSFLVGLQNLDLNITQEDVQATESRLNDVLMEQVQQIHAHLEEQDRKIDKLLEGKNT